MPATFHWYLPTTADSRALVGGGHSIPADLARGGGSHAAWRFREPHPGYLTDVARTAEQLGFAGVLTPTGTPCEEAWVITLALLRETERLMFLRVFRGAFTPEGIDHHGTYDDVTEAAEVADLIETDAVLGIDEFVLSGYPHIEEASWFAEGVLPVLQARGVAA